MSTNISGNSQILNYLDPLVISAHVSPQGLRDIPLSDPSVHEGFLADILSPLWPLSISLHFCRLCSKDFIVHSTVMLNYWVIMSYPGKPKNPLKKRMVMTALLKSDYFQYTWQRFLFTNRIFIWLYLRSQLFSLNRFSSYITKFIKQQKSKKLLKHYGTLSPKPLT